MLIWTGIVLLNRASAWLRYLLALANQFSSIAFRGIIIGCLLQPILQNRLTRADRSKIPTSIFL
ncbi:MAG: hypothetical protein P8O70_05455, partial [SAR324 cluster bacterium]|nr:hypothetical protein [SAR324 cluster bacterium]